MRNWCAGLGLGVLLGLAAACGDDPAPSENPSASGAAGEGLTPGGGGALDSGAGGAAGSESPDAAAGNGGGGGLPTSVDVSSYCDLLSEGYVAWLVECYGTSQYPEAAATLLLEQTRRSCRLSEASVRDGRLAFDADAALLCLRDLDAESCDGFDFMGRQPLCQRVFAPLAEPGDECFGDTTRSALLGAVTSECQSGYCDVSESCPGSCKAFKVDAQPCSASSECLPESYCGEDGCTPRKGAFSECSGDTCSPGLHCVYPPSAMFGLCMAPSTPGQACADDEPCSTGFYCIAGQCRSKVDSGEPCEVTLNCRSGERCLDRDGAGATCGPAGTDDAPCREGNDCADTHYCPISAPRVCSPRAQVGEACVSGQCEGDAWCNLELGECAAPGGEGDSCRVSGSLNPQACRGGLYCMADGACHEPGGDGAPCSPANAETCSSGYFCSRGTSTCQLPVGMGELCNPFSPSSCADGLGCLCTDPACEPDLADPVVEDSLHTCSLRRSAGDECFGDQECEAGSSCLGGAIGTCTPSRSECVP